MNTKKGFSFNNEMFQFLSSAFPNSIRFLPVLLWYCQIRLQILKVKPRILAIRVPGPCLNYAGHNNSSLCARCKELRSSIYIHIYCGSTEGGGETFQELTKFLLQGLQQ